MAEGRLPLNRDSITGCSEIARARERILEDKERDFDSELMKSVTRKEVGIVDAGEADWQFVTLRRLFVPVAAFLYVSLVRASVFWASILSRASIVLNVLCHNTFLLLSTSESNSLKVLAIPT